MKATTLLRYYLLYAFIFIGLLQAEGFTAKTLVTTQSGHTNIEQLQIGDAVISATHAHTAVEYPITNAPAIIDVAKAAFASAVFLGTYLIQKRSEKKIQSNSRTKAKLNYKRQFQQQ